MNKSAIKIFAIWARKKMIADVREKAAMAGITDKGIDQAMGASTDEIQYFDNGTSTPFVLTGKDIAARKNLAGMLRQNEKETNYATAYKNMLEETASAWFNRLIAIRYMEVNDYFADHLRVLSSAEADRKDPDIVIRPFESDLEFTETERLQIIQWKMENENDTLFRFLFKKKCNKLQGLLSGLFENDEKDMAFRLISHLLIKMV